jgi:tetratricopeptide (TPR) repeat protein
MKLTCLLIGVCLFVSFSHSLHAQAVTPGDLNIDKSPELSAIQKEFTNLPEQQRIDYIKLLNEANRLFQQKRIFETLAQIHDARKIFDKNSDVFNLLGSCYVEFRDFETAMKHFQKADSLSPKSPIILFNIAEVEFVTRKWKSSLEKMKQVLTLLDEKEIATRRLVEFKIMLCHIALGQNEPAEALAKKFDPIMDDTPYYYYAQAALAFRDKDEEKAQSFLLMALRVFRHPQILAHWDDTLIEFGYVKSFYGGELEELKEEE